MGKKLLSLLAVLTLCITFVMPAMAEDKVYFIDNAGLVSSEEAAELNDLCESTSDECNMDMVVLTVEDTGSSTATEYADDYFDDNGYGRGDDYDGILLLIDMDTRSWAISTSGYAVDVFTDSNQSVLTDTVLPYLSDGDYYTAFVQFIYSADFLVYSANSGDVTDYEDYSSSGESSVPDDYYDVSYEGSSSFITGDNFLMRLIISLVVGLLLAGIPISAWKKKLKNVHFSGNASEYMVPGSFNLTVSRDSFLYRNVTRTAKPKDNGGSGGSSTHTASSGHSHGGSSGHF